MEQERHMSPMSSRHPPSSCPGESRLSVSRTPAAGRLHNSETTSPSSAGASASETRGRLLEGQLESCQLAPRVVEHSERFAARRSPKPAVEPSCQRPLLVALSGSGRVCSGPIFDQAVHRGVYAQAGGRSVWNPLLASLANRDDCDRDTAGCCPGHKCRHMLRRRSRRALAEVIDSP
jgi:hypothetical protein